jgi:polysaccharide export outer membrane protein
MTLAAALLSTAPAIARGIAAGSPVVAHPDTTRAGDAGRGIPARRAGTSPVDFAFGAEHGWGSPAMGPARRVGSSAATTQAQTQPPAKPTTPAKTAQPPQMPPSAQLPSGYVIGPDDVLAVIFWRDKDMSTEAVVRPDGKITLPLINEVQAAGLTPEQLRDNLQQAATKYLEDPNVSVVVKTINSRKVFITGQVAKPGAYSLTGPTTVMQLIALAGGLNEFADSKNILIMRTENGKPVAYPFNYKDVLKRKNLRQNIELKPGDTVVVP